MLQNFCVFHPLMSDAQQVDRGNYEETAAKTGVNLADIRS